MDKWTIRAELKILCVMGDTLNQDLKKFLQASDCPHVADFVSDAFSAIRRHEQGSEDDDPYDLIFIEYLLDDTSGIELAKRLKVIDREVLPVLLPTIFLSLEEVRKEYVLFGDFFLELDFMNMDYSHVLDCAVEYKLKHFKVKSNNELYIAKGVTGDIR